jgi:hypothetical protein
MSFRVAPRRYCLSPISRGTAFAHRILFTTIESKPYSSGQKNMPAIIDVSIDSHPARISRWSRPHFRGGLRKLDYSRSSAKDLYKFRTFLDEVTFENLHRFKRLLQDANVLLDRASRPDRWARPARPSEKTQL